MFFLNGCNEPEIREKIVYVNRPVPKLKLLNKVEFHEVVDYKSFNEQYWLINKVEFDIASARVLKKEHKIQFYEKQNIDFNKKFVLKTKEES